MFDERKTAQIAAYLLQKSGGRLSILKLMKLLYLSDREAMSRYDRPMTYDHMVSMPHGPVLSQTYDLMGGSTRSQAGGWEDWISDRDNHEVSLKKSTASRNDFFKLSDADIDVIDHVWEKFGHMDQWVLRDYTHDNCAEWEDPDGSSNPIFYKDVFLALGRALPQAKMLDEQIREQASIEAIFDSI